MGPWTILFTVSGVVFGTSWIVQKKLNELPDLITRPDSQYDYIIGEFCICISKTIMHNSFGDYFYDGMLLLLLQIKNGFIVIHPLVNRHI